MSLAIFAIVWGVVTGFVGSIIFPRSWSFWHKSTGSALLAMATVVPALYAYLLLGGSIE